MANDLNLLAADGISVTLDLRVGHIRELTITRGGRTIMPLHTAPWVEDRTITNDPTIPPSLQLLSGDFFCAPFCTSDVEPAPPHGWPANGAWEHIGTRSIEGGAEASFRLYRPVMGAVVEKTLTVRDGHPFLYQTHAFTGGSGRIPVSTHAMTRFATGGRLAFSAKAWAETPQSAPEGDPGRGRSLLRYPQRALGSTRLELVSGGEADIAHFPFAVRHEDVVFLREAAGHDLGWIAALRSSSGDMMLSLKNPRDYPVTTLWFSNGGREYSPWNGRHIGVLGVEEGRTFGSSGHRESITHNRWNEEGIATSLDLAPSGRVQMRHVIGGIEWPDEADVTGVVAVGSRLVVQFAGGRSLELPFDAVYLQ